MLARILLSINSVVLDDTQREYLLSLSAEWVVVKELDYRFLVHSIALFDQVPTLQDVLTSMGLLPVVIGCWDQQGATVSELYPFNSTELVKFSPDQSPLHQFSGWVDQSEVTVG